MSNRVARLEVAFKVAPRCGKRSCAGYTGTGSVLPISVVLVICLFSIFALANRVSSFPFFHFCVGFLFLLASTDSIFVLICYVKNNNHITVERRPKDSEAYYFIATSAECPVYRSCSFY